MKLLYESLYGWGVCDIPTPRAALDIFSDRRRRATRISFSDRRKRALEQGMVSIGRGIFIQDVPWTQTVVLSFVALFSFASIYIVSQAIPKYPEKELFDPVDIVVSVIEDTMHKRSLLIHQTTPPVEEVREQRQPHMPVKTRPIKRQGPVPGQTPITAPENTLNPVALAKKIKSRPLKASQIDVPKSDSLDNATQRQEIMISGPVGLKRNYSINDNAGNFEQEQPHFISNSFATQPVAATVTISQRNRLKKKYTIGTANPGMAISSDRMSQSNVVDFTRPANLVGIGLPETDQSGRRYSLEDQGTPYQSAVSPHTDNTSLSFGPQNGEKNLASIPQNLLTSVSRKPRPVHSRPAGGESAPDFSGPATSDEIDPSHLMSLNEFNVCTDPEEEFQLKTKLATLLEGPSMFRTREIMFFFKHTELPYTINVNVYNPEGELFQDRCSVLQLAITCIRNTKK